MGMSSFDAEDTHTAEGQTSFLYLQRLRQHDVGPNHCPDCIANHAFVRMHLNPLVPGQEICLRLASSRITEQQLASATLGSRTSPSMTCCCAKV